MEKEVKEILMERSLSEREIMLQDRNRKHGVGLFMDLSSVAGGVFW